MTEYVAPIVSVLIGMFLVIGYKRIRRAQAAQVTVFNTLLSTLIDTVKDTSTNIYNEVNNLWLEQNRAKLRPQFCSIILMHPSTDIAIPQSGTEERSKTLKIPGCLMSATIWLGPDQEHSFNFAPDVPLPIGTSFVVTGPCSLEDVIIANRSQTNFVGTLGQIAVSRDACHPGMRIVIRLKGWPLRPSTLSEAELVRESQKRGLTQTARGLVD